MMKSSGFEPPFEERAPKSAEALSQEIIKHAAMKVLEPIRGKNIPAAELTDNQKCALYALAGFMKLENGRLVSIRPVSIEDDGNGKYIVAITPESTPNA